MADLQFVNFAVIPGPGRKEKQFGLPDDFSKIDVTTLSPTTHSASGFPAVFRVFTGGADGPLYGDPQISSRTFEK